MRDASRCATAAIFACLLGVNGVVCAMEVDVRAPVGTSGDATLFVAGSSLALGEWKDKGLKLHHNGDRDYEAILHVDPGQTLEFKITRGSWATVEKDADGGERANRSVTITPDTKSIDVVVERWADVADVSDAATKPAGSVVGTLELHTIESNALGTSRTIRVWLPPGYDAMGDARYDVLYLHDGQNCFDRATSAFGHEWGVDETLTRLIAEKKIRPLIVVGIDNGGAARLDEMTYAADPQGRGGHATSYATFVIDEVKPFIEETYRAAKGPAHTFLGGASLGGLVSLDLVRRHEGVFGGVIAMSPSLWWPGEPITPAVTTDAGGLKSARVWLDIGDREAGDDLVKDAGYVDDAQRMDTALTKQHVDHKLTIAKGAAHNEEAWSARFADAIQYLLAPK